MKSALFVGTTSVFLSLFCAVFGEEKNGLLVTVGKKTLDRNDTRTSSYYLYNRIDRTQGLKITIKNVSFKEMPTGEVNWTLVVRSHLGGQPTGYLGKETVKALKPAETAELIIGAAEVRGWNDGSYQAKDKVEHQIIISQGGKETLRVESTPSFESLAKQAYFSTSTKGRPAAP